LSNLEHLQVNLILFAMVLGGLSLQKNKKEFAGSMLIGAAASLKIMSIAFVPYLIYKRRWRSAAFTSLWIALFSLSPILMFGWDTYWKYVKEFKAALDLGWWTGSMNHSVFAMWDKLIGYGIIPVVDNVSHGFPVSGNPIARVASLLSLAIVTVISAWIFQKQPQDKFGGSVRWSELAEWSIVFIVSTIFGPVTWNAFLVVLLLPNALLFAIWRSTMDHKTRRLALIVMISSFALSLISTPGIVGHSVTVILHMSSIITVAVLIILWGMLDLRTRL
jgi:alpha-1,2-mannosyltransferase